MGSKKDRKRTSMAMLADRHALYQKSVQDPESEINLMAKKYRKIRGRDAISFREDFCGTAYLSTEWCKTRPDRTAIGVDLCKDTLAWGKVHNVDAAPKNVAGRVRLVHANVLEYQAEPVDLTCALNFSYCVFKDRDTLRSYFRAAHRGLNQDGILVLDLLGGTATIDTLEEEREVEDEDFIYVWDQHKFNPVTADFECRIHFRFPDGSSIENAYIYEWRLWTIPELRELLLEAGFSKVRVFWEEFRNTDDDSEYLESTGKYKEVTEVENQESWVSYIFAEA